jgi:hypothetical protein
MWILWWNSRVGLLGKIEFRSCLCLGVLVVGGLAWGDTAECGGSVETCVLFFGFGKVFLRVSQMIRLSSRCFFSDLGTVS